MLNRIETRIGSDTFHLPLDPSATINQEGAALVLVVRNGVSYATPCTGVPGEKFVGFSTGYGSAAEGESIQYITADVPSGTGPNGDPLAPELYVNSELVLRAKLSIAGTAADAVDAEADVVAGKFFIKNGNILVFAAADAGKKVTGYVASKRLGDVTYAGGVGNGGTIAIIRSGTISTDMFDPDASYIGASDEAPIPLYTGPNGTLTAATGGTLVEDISLLIAPEVNDGWLQVRALG